MLAEIIGPGGRIHYRRPVGDPLIAEALATPGYRVQYVAVETVETPGVCAVCGGSEIEQVYAGHGNVKEIPCSMCTDKSAI